MLRMDDFFSADHPREVPPGTYPARDEALALVNRDLAALLPDLEPLRLMAMPARPEEPADDERAEHLHITLADGRWHGNDLPQDPQTGAEVLADMAEAAQETVLECLWRVWPECAAHRLGMHAGLEGGRAVWRCAGGPGPAETDHVEPIGALVAAYRPRAERRRQRNRDKGGRPGGASGPFPADSQLQ